MALRILVCGGRDFQDWKLVVKSLDAVHAKNGIELIIEGGAKGADGHAAIWADNNLIPRMTFHANWKHLGKNAGPIRNSNMLVYGQPDGVVAFEGGTGTENMVGQAKEAGIPVWEVRSAKQS